MNIASSLRLLPATALLMALAACKGDEAARRDNDHEAKPAAAKASVAYTGKKVDVKMISDAKGERYDPVEIEVSRGDSLRFVLASGVHNVHFMSEKPSGAIQFPPTSAYLQLPGQTISYLMDFPEGRYYYQCDIHVALGMKGYVKVEDEGSTP